MNSFMLGMIAGGALIYLFPGLGVAGNAWFNRLRRWWDDIV